MKPHNVVNYKYAVCVMCQSTFLENTFIILKTQYFLFNSNLISKLFKMLANHNNLELLKLSKTNVLSRISSTSLWCNLASYYNFKPLFCSKYNVSKRPFDWTRGTHASRNHLSRYNGNRLGNNRFSMIILLSLIKT